MIHINTTSESASGSSSSAALCTPPPSVPSIVFNNPHFPQNSSVSADPSLTAALPTVPIPYDQVKKAAVAGKTNKKVTVGISPVKPSIVKRPPSSGSSNKGQSSDMSAFAVKNRSLGEYVKRLLGHRLAPPKPEDNGDFAEQLLMNLSRKIFDDESKIAAFEMAIAEKSETSPCILLPRPKNGRITISKSGVNTSKKVFPQILLCQTFRWPNIIFYNDIRSKADVCESPCAIKPAEENSADQSSQQDGGDAAMICINPYHYDLTPTAILRMNSNKVMGVPGKKKKPRIEELANSVAEKYIKKASSSGGSLTAALQQPKQRRPQGSQHQVKKFDDDGVDYISLWDSEAKDAVESNGQIQAFDEKMLLEEIKFLTLKPDKNVQEFERVDCKVMEDLKLLGQLKSILNDEYISEFKDEKPDPPPSAVKKEGPKVHVQTSSIKPQQLNQPQKTVSPKIVKQVSKLSPSVSQQKSVINSELANLPSGISVTITPSLKSPPVMQKQQQQPQQQQSRGVSSLPLSTLSAVEFDESDDDEIISLPDDDDEVEDIGDEEEEVSIIAIPPPSQAIQPVGQGQSVLKGPTININRPTPASSAPTISLSSVLRTQNISITTSSATASATPLPVVQPQEDDTVIQGLLNDIQGSFERQFDEEFEDISGADLDLESVDLLGGGQRPQQQQQQRVIQQPQMMQQQSSSNMPFILNTWSESQPSPPMRTTGGSVTTTQRTDALLSPPIQGDNEEEDELRSFFPQHQGIRIQQQRQQQQPMSINQPFSPQASIQPQLLMNEQQQQPFQSQQFFSQEQQQPMQQGYGIQQQFYQQTQGQYQQQQQYDFMGQQRQTQQQHQQNQHQNQGSGSFY